MSKKIIISTAIALFFICALKAQTNTTLPTFEGTDLVLRTEEKANYYSVSISTSIGQPYTAGYDKTEKNPTGYLADILVQLRKQMYKLVISHSGSFGYGSNTVNGNNNMITYYIFEKE